MNIPWTVSIPVFSEFTDFIRCTLYIHLILFIIISISSVCFHISVSCFLRHNRYFSNSCKLFLLSKKSKIVTYFYGFNPHTYITAVIRRNVCNSSTLSYALFYRHIYHEFITRMAIHIFYGYAAINKSQITCILLNYSYLNPVSHLYNILIDLQAKPQADIRYSIHNP